MDMVKLGKKGQVSIPRAILRRLGLTGEVPMLVETTPDGSILLRPAGVYPIETYSEDRIREFAEADRLAVATSVRVARRSTESQRRRERRVAEQPPARAVRRR